MNRKTSVSNKFKVFDDLSKETFENQSEGKQGNHTHMETVEIASHMQDEATKENPQEVGDRETREEAEDMDIGDLDLEGIKQAYADV